MFLNFLRMGQWAVFTVVLFCLAFLSQHYVPGTMLAVSLYKAHLLALGGWGGYWLDRALFPYDRPHEYWEAEAEEVLQLGPNEGGPTATMAVTTECYGHAMLRRAIVVAAALICVGLGA